MKDEIWSQNVAELQRVIEDWLLKRPKSRNSAEYKAWVMRMKVLYHEYNTIVGATIYTFNKPTK